MANYYLKVNIIMEKEMEKEKNFIMILHQNLKDNIYMDKKMVKEKNIIIMANYYLKENILVEKNGMEMDII